ncbi:MAG: queuosine precursor transporter [Bacteroidaceae bacterium]|nr:queuosine precursor transporter [Bacteroidaceae bacterium]
MSEKTNSAGQHALSVTFVVLAVTFCVCLITSNLFVPRLWRVGNNWMQLSGAVIIFPISYIINDLLTEVYGYKKAMNVIWMGFIMSAFVAVAAHVVSILPMPIDENSQAIAQSFNGLFGMIPRTTAASLLAFILGSYMNSIVLSKMKIATKGKGFGWRAITSTIAGELSDSVIFYPLAFLGTMPVRTILSIIVTQVTVKTLYEIVILPVTALISRKLKAKECIDTFDYDVKYNPFKLK